MGEQQLEVRGVRKLRRVAEAAVVAVVAAAETFARLLERRAREVREVVGAAGRQLVERLHEPAAALADLRALRAVVVLDRGEHFAKRGHPVAALAREIGAREDRQVAVGRQEHGQRPAARSARVELVRGLVDLVDVGPLLAIDLHVHEQIVHELRGGFVLERLVRHHVAPVTRRIADREQDRLVGRARGLERGLAPGLPVHGVVRVLEKVGARLFVQAVAHERHYRAARRSVQRAGGSLAARRSGYTNGHATPHVVPRLAILRVTFVVHVSQLRSRGFQHRTGRRALVRDHVPRGIPARVARAARAREAPVEQVGPASRRRRVLRRRSARSSAGASATCSSTGSASSSRIR